MFAWPGKAIDGEERRSVGEEDRQWASAGSLIERLERVGGDSREIVTTFRGQIKGI